MFFPVDIVVNFLFLMYVVISVTVLYCDIWYLSQGPDRVRNARLMVMATCQGVRVTKMDVTKN